MSIHRSLFYFCNMYINHFACLSPKGESVGAENTGGGFSRGEGAARNYAKNVQLVNERFQEMRRLRRKYKEG